ncbi:hypothetical protein DMC30DRAFT_393516 [Rhodotorula diobovata]|uniref:Protein CPL1-like domain-containing protein n=1 Tax=Rhodotorula diobovata TaxID=5288 RepID=A0A5C5G0V0_9BASI|nr:hypothetical protein DMC30DRAFT_393516 [Rhodotorula diobovata]
MANDEVRDAVPPDALLVLTAPFHEQAKRDLLCPDGLTACPIAGSASLRDASSAPSRGDPRSVAELLRAFADEVARSRGGYECIDVGSEGSSCGGCATLGEGRDCERDVEHATAAGCGEGRCVVFACERGWRPDRDARRCVRSGVPGETRRDKGRTHGQRGSKRRLHGGQ